MEIMEKPDPFLNEILQNAKEQSRERGYSLEYLEGALDWILSMTRVKLDETDRARHLAKLSTYPHWKIKRISDFNGYFSELYKFLEGLQPDIESVRAVFPDAVLLEDHQGKGNDEMAKDFFSYIKRLFGTQDRTERAKIERAHILRMRAKYPGHSWKAGMKGNADI